MDYTKIDTSKVSVNENKDIVLPAPVVTMDDLSAQMNKLHEVRGNLLGALDNNKQALDRLQRACDDTKKQIDEIELQISSLQSLLDSAVEKGAAVSVAVIP